MLDGAIAGGSALAIETVRADRRYGDLPVIPPLEPGSHTIVVKDDIDDLSNEDPPTTAQLTANVTVSE